MNDFNADGSNTETAKLLKAKLYKTRTVHLVKSVRRANVGMYVTFCGLPVLETYDYVGIYVPNGKQCNKCWWR